MEVLARRVIRPVDLAMTVGAAPIKGESQFNATRCARMARVDMTLSTNPRVSYLE